ncbi:MAG: VapC toxin family PIN domain ribonuclease [Gammaproteobacteria bacterium]|nr:MAG: VapC toxin family PIN domain ribonuclease [Gammaproteobacteria bacterium]
MFFLDTNIISELRLAAKGKGDANVLAWAQCYEKTLFYTNVVVMMELERGILNIERKDHQQAQALTRWLERTVKPTFEQRIFPIDSATASICAGLHVPDRAPENDAWIAASAIQYDLTLVTRNHKDFAHLGVRLYNPFLS